MNVESVRETKRLLATRRQPCPGPLSITAVRAQQAARTRSRHLIEHRTRELERSRGESAYVIDVGGRLIASVTDCLGTKTLLANAARQITGRTYYDSLAQDTIAMAVNDLLTVGATRLAVQAYRAAGGSERFTDSERMEDLIRGWQDACDVCSESWGGGETPALDGVVAPNGIDLAASCIGVVEPRARLMLGESLAPGDAIVLFASSGIHANGVTLARRVAGRLAEGYAARLANGRRLGDALLDPTILYAPIIQRFRETGAQAHYCVNITGHGWRKLMRHPAQLTYPITEVPPIHATDALRAARDVNVPAWIARKVEPGPRRVVIEPLGITYDAQQLTLRA